MELGLSGKNVIVTGGGSNIGRAFSFSGGKDGKDVNPAAPEPNAPQFRSSCAHRSGVEGLSSLEAALRLRSG